jgi:hypothetical protein
MIMPSCISDMIMPSRITEAVNLHLIEVTKTIAPVRAAFT